MTTFPISDSRPPKSREPYVRRCGFWPRSLFSLRFVFALFVSLFHLSTPISVCAQSSTAEYQLKAAFIFHFAQLVDWPPEVLGYPDRVLTFCIADENALLGLLEGTVRGKRVGSHLLQVRHLLENDNPRACDLLFVVRQDKKRTAALLKAVNNAPILTIGESDDFLQQGGIIGFCFQGNKTRFDINLPAARRANIKVSSRLLLLARNVIGDSRQG